MIPQTVERNVNIVGALRTGQFSIKAEDASFIFAILRDKLYSDKKLAVLREIACNAVDAHVAAGIPHVPIKVNMPTAFDSTLVIRDFGKGLSEDDIFSVFIMYGASSKRGSDKEIGSYGIGAKSPFAYSDSFSVTSHHNGKASVYTAVLDASNTGTMTKLYEEDTTETGIEVKIPVRPSDIKEFVEKATNLFSFFQPRPKINIDLPLVLETVSEMGFINKNALPGWPDRWVVTMGNVPYRIRWHMVEKMFAEDKGVFRLLERLYGGVFFNIGELDISANREEIEYTDKTKRAVAERIRELVLYYTETHFTETVEKAATGLERRRAMYKYVDTGLPIPEAFAYLRASSVVIHHARPVKPAPAAPAPSQVVDGEVLVSDGNGGQVVTPVKVSKKTGKIVKPEEDTESFDERAADAKAPPYPKYFQLRYINGIGGGEKFRIRYHRVNHLPVPIRANSELPPPLLIIDTDKALHHYRTTGHYRLPQLTSHAVSFVAGKEKEGLAELEDYLRMAELDPYPMVRLSSLVYEPPAAKVVDPKYRQKYFVLAYGGSNNGSGNWEVATRQPTKTDPFVLMSHFVSDPPANHLMSILTRAKAFGLNIEIFGVKSTRAKPVDPDNIPATPFREWEKTVFIEEIKKTRIAEYMIDFVWAERTGEVFQDYSTDRTLNPHRKRVIEKHDVLEGTLGAGHPLVQFYKERVWRKARFEALPLEEQRGVKKLTELYPTMCGSRHRDIAKQLAERYPLAKFMPQGIESLFVELLHKEHFEAYAEYVRLIDKERG